MFTGNFVDVCSIGLLDRFDRGTKTFHNILRGTSAKKVERHCFKRISAISCFIAGKAKVLLKNDVFR